MAYTSKMEYQETINNLFAPLNESKAVYPPYPSYHTGPYLEEMVVENSRMVGDRYLIPVFWTNVYKEGKNQLLQSLISQLDVTKKYYCVCTHDDAPLETLPPNTMVFSAGGNNTNTIPIPLVVSPVPVSENIKKDIEASFVGSYTHPLRAYMQRFCPEGYVTHMDPQWSERVTQERFEAFQDRSMRSRFMLCPRGYGPTSYRLYEAFQYGAVPVYISDRFWLPWSEDLEWDKLIIKITPDKIPSMQSIISSLSEEKRMTMVEYAKDIYEEFFSLRGVVNKILDKVI